MVMKKNARLVCFFLFIVIFLLGAFSNFCYSDSSIDVVYLDETLLPVFIEEGEIPLGEELVVYCPLVQWKEYHIYLIGEWLDFENPVTDYDIIVYDPYNEKMLEASDSAGLPEQISTDKRHQFFIPEKSGVHKFVIKNDESDSEKAESAVFMIMEHIELDKGFRTLLQGRSPGVNTYEGAIYYKCFEFDTDEPFFQVHLEVPENLEMYEARLYRMASFDDVGLDMDGLMVPPWEFLEGVRLKDFGGFDYKHKSNITRDTELIASCDDFGEDMYINYGNRSLVNGDNIFYYLVLLAEFGQGEVTFYVKTDTSSPSLELIEPYGDLVVGEKSVFKVEVDQNRKIESVWIDYSIDKWETTETCFFSKEGEYWICELPFFDYNEKIQYVINAKNDLGNVGKINGVKEVKKEVDLFIELSEEECSAGNSISVQGSIGIDDSSLELFFINGNSNQNYKIKTNSQLFQHEFYPNRLGKWVVYAQYGGDQEYGLTRSEPQEFEVKPLEIILFAQSEKEDVIVGEKVFIQGSTEPGLSDIPLIVTYGVSNYEREQVKTEETGEFSSFYIPEESGTCEILVEIKGDWKYGSVQSQILTVNVHERTLLKVMMNTVNNALTPPTLYMTLGAVLVILLLVVLQIWRTRA